MWVHNLAQRRFLAVEQNGLQWTRKQRIHCSAGPQGGVTNPEEREHTEIIHSCFKLYPEEAGTATGHEKNMIEQSQMHSRKYFPNLKRQRIKSLLNTLGSETHHNSTPFEPKNSLPASLPSHTCPFMKSPQPVVRSENFFFHFLLLFTAHLHVCSKFSAAT